MSVPQPAYDLIKSFEGLYLKAYVCPAGIWTIGYGSTRIDGRPVKSDDVLKNEAHAFALMQEEVERVGVRVRSMAQVPTDGQFGALVSFAYNLGCGALKGSTLLRKHNAGDYEGAAEQFKKWVFGGGKKLPGLIRRRDAEARLYLS